MTHRPIALPQRLVAGLKTLAILLLLSISGAPLARIPAVQAIGPVVERHRVWIVGAAILLLVTGFVLFFGGLLAMTLRKGAWLRGEDLDEYYRGMSQPALGVRVGVAFACGTKPGSFG